MKKEIKKSLDEKMQVKLPESLEREAIVEQLDSTVQAVTPKKGKRSYAKIIVPLAASLALVVGIAGMFPGMRAKLNNTAEKSDNTTTLQNQVVGFSDYEEIYKKFNTMKKSMYVDETMEGVKLFGNAETAEDILDGGADTETSAGTNGSATGTGIDDTAEAAQATDDARETVMVVDDNPDILKYICEALSEHYNVLPAANGAKAIETLSSNTVDLIITDIMMPDIDGVQLCRTVKRNLRTSHIPVIMLSAKSDTNDFLGGLKVGADDYIAKPFSLDILSQKVRNLLHTRRQTIRHFTDLADDKKTDVPALNPLDEEFIKKALDTMENYVDDSEFTTDRFAAEMCMSRSNLHLKMKALTGESTNEFMRRFRMRRAMDLLKSGRYTISQVSAMVGYGTPSYFATSFKKFFGDLPSNSIKHLRPNEPD